MCAVSRVDDLNMFKELADKLGIKIDLSNYTPRVLTCATPASVLNLKVTKQNAVFEIVEAELGGIYTFKCDRSTANKIAEFILEDGCENG